MGDRYRRFDQLRARTSRVGPEDRGLYLFVAGARLESQSACEELHGEPAYSLRAGQSAPALSRCALLALVSAADAHPQPVELVERHAVAVVLDDQLVAGEVDADAGGVGVVAVLDQLAELGEQGRVD